MPVRKIKNKFNNSYNVLFVEKNTKHLFSDKINCFSKKGKNIIKEKQAKICITIKRNNLFNKLRLIRLLAFLKTITGSNICVKKTKVKIKHKVRDFILVGMSVVKKEFYPRFINFLLRVKSLLEYLNKTYNNVLSIRGELNLNVSKNIKFSLMYNRFIRRFKRVRLPMLFSLKESYETLDFFADYLLNLYTLQVQKKLHFKIDDERTFLKIFKKTNKISDL